MQKKIQQNQEYIDNFVSSLTTCEAKTLKNIAALEKIQVKNISFSKISSNYDFDTWASQGGQNNRITDITLQADVQTNTSHEKLQKLKERTDSLCAVHKLIPGTGVKIKTVWRNKKRQ